jgi:hypothetical protein
VKSVFLTTTDNVHLAVQVVYHATALNVFNAMKVFLKLHQFALFNVKKVFIQTVQNVYLAKSLARPAQVHQVQIVYLALMILSCFNQLALIFNLDVLKIILKILEFVSCALKIV